MNAHIMKNILSDRKGIALVMSLIISLGIMVLVTGVLYFTVQSTRISGAGKTYSSAEDAGEGAVELIKDCIVNVQNTDSCPAQVMEADPDNPCITNAVIIGGQSCTTTIYLPGEYGTDYTATVTFENLVRMALPGSRLEFGRSGGASATGVYYRVLVNVTDANNASASESTILFRYTG